MHGTGPGGALHTHLASLIDPFYFVLSNLEKATACEQGFSCSCGVVRTSVAGRRQTPGCCNRRALLSSALTHHFHTFQLPREQRRGVLRHQCSLVGSPETQREVGTTWLRQPGVGLTPLGARAFVSRFPSTTKSPSVGWMI